MKKKLLIFTASLFALLGIGTFAGYSWLTARFEKDAVIAQVEQWWDCRATLESSTVNLLSTPATVELRGLKLAISDDEVTKPYAQRSAFPEDQALLVAEHATLSVTLKDLLSRRYNIEKLHISNLRLRTEIDTEGDSTLDMMFDSPEDESEPLPAEQVQTKRPLNALAANISSEPPQTGDPAKPKKKRTKKRKKDKEPFKASDLGLALQVQEASVNNGSFEIVDFKNQTHMTLSNIALTLSDIDVDPNNLAAHNRSNLKFAGDIKTAKTDSTEVTANFNVQGDGVFHPFAPDTGLWFPDLGLNILIKKGSSFGGAPLETQMREKDMKKMREYGLDLTGLAMGGVLQDDLVTQIHAIGSKMIIGRDTHLIFPDYGITLLQKSWINAAEDDHRLNGRFTANPELSQRVLSGAQAKLGEKYGDTVAALAQATINATFMDEQKRLIIPIKSRGPLSKPDVSLDGTIGDITDSLKSAGKSLLEGLLNN